MVKQDQNQEILHKKIFYGRRKGRPLTSYRQSLYDTQLPNLQVQRPWSVPEGLRNKKQLRLEIGFGSGEHLAEQAKNHPEIGFLGCEIFINGIVSLLTYINQWKLSNISLFTEDIRLLLPEIPDATFDRIDILFSDPWPKKRHHKRRLVNDEMLSNFMRILKSQGFVRFVTDDEHYATQIEEICLQSNHYKIKNKDFLSPPLDWIPTRYAQRAERLKNQIYYYDIARKI